MTKEEQRELVKTYMESVDEIVRDFQVWLMDNVAEFIVKNPGVAIRSVAVEKSSDRHLVLVINGQMQTESHD